MAEVTSYTRYIRTKQAEAKAPMVHGPEHPSVMNGPKTFHQANPDEYPRVGRTIRNRLVYLYHGLRYSSCSSTDYKINKVKHRRRYLQLHHIHHPMLPCQALRCISQHRHLRRRRTLQRHRSPTSLPHRLRPQRYQRNSKAL